MMDFMGYSGPVIRRTARPGNSWVGERTAEADSAAAQSDQAAS
jgi:hypothetical protein